MDCPPRASKKEHTVLADTLISAQRDPLLGSQPTYGGINEFELLKLLNVRQVVASTMENKYTSCSGLNVYVLPKFLCRNPKAQGDNIRDWAWGGDEVMSVGPSEWD